MKLIIKLFFIGLLTFLAIQFVPIERNSKEINPKTDFITTEKPSKKIANLLKNSCYDCHSNQTKYPKYADYAPISWSIASHINDGKKHLNFSEWQNYNSEQKSHSLKNALELVKIGKMPMLSYVCMHAEAKLSTNDKLELEKYFNKLISK